MNKKSEYVKRMISTILMLVLVFGTLTYEGSYKVKAENLGHYWYSQYGWNLGSAESSMCYLTSYAMVISNAGKVITPADVYRANGNTSYAYHNKIADAFGITTVQTNLSGISSTAKKQMIVNALLSNPWGVIVGGQYSSDSWHYVVAYKVDNNEVIFDDPAYKSSEKGCLIGISSTYKLNWDNISRLRTITPSWNVNQPTSVSSITLQGENWPTNLNVGDRFWFTGTVSSSKPLRFVYAAVLNASGNEMTCGYKEPHTYSVDIAKELDASIVMQNLPQGVYQYMISAGDESGYEKVLLTKFFNVGAVWSGTTTPSINAGTASRDTVISWSSTSNTSHYDLYIFRSDNLNENYKVFYNITGNSYSVRLPEGDYVAWLASVNDNFYDCYKFGEKTQPFHVSAGNGVIPAITKYWNGHIYSLYNENMSWNNAEELCESVSGHLATVTSADEDAMLIDMQKSGKCDSYWLGASDKESEGNWKWVTGEQINYSNWYTGQPDNCNSNEHYLGYNPNKQWNDFDGRSNETIGFICEIDVSDWNPVAVSYYKGNTYALYNDLTSWNDAKVFAETRGGHLVTLTDSDENDVVLDLIKDRADTHCWIGASDHDRKVNDFAWLTGESFGYSNWDVSYYEPNNTGGEEDFAEIYKHNGLWNDNTNMFPCDFVIEYENDAISIVLDKQSEEINIHDTIKLNATVKPIYAPVIWSSEDESIATVTDGVVKGISKGTTIIKASFGKQYAECEVTVKSAGVISVGSLNGRPVSSLEIPIAISSCPSDMRSIGITVSYDTDVLKLKGIRNGTVINDAAMMISGKYGSPYNIIWSDSMLDTSNGIPFLNKIESSQVSGILLAVLNFDVIRLPENGVTDIDVELIPNKTFNAEGILYYDTEKGSVSIEYIPGDVNNDGEVTTLDATFIKRHIVGGYDIPTFIEANADVNGDGQITTLDATLIKRSIVGGYDVVLV